MDFLLPDVISSVASPARISVCMHRNCSRLFQTRIFSRRAAVIRESIIRLNICSTENVIRCILITAGNEGVNRGEGIIHFLAEFRYSFILLFFEMKLRNNRWIFHSFLKERTRNSFYRECQITSRHPGYPSIASLSRNK